MADDLLLRNSLQRERAEIARLQSQLQQQQIQQQPTTTNKLVSQSTTAAAASTTTMTTATGTAPAIPTTSASSSIALPRQRLDLAEQQRRLLELQRQQQQFQQQQHQHRHFHQHQQQRPQQHFGHQQPQTTGAVPPPSTPTTTACTPVSSSSPPFACPSSSPALANAAAAALAQLLGGGHGHAQLGTGASKVQNPPLPLHPQQHHPQHPHQLPQLMSPTPAATAFAAQLAAAQLDWRLFLSPMAAASATTDAGADYSKLAPLEAMVNKIAQFDNNFNSPCPTPAYHYQLAAPKPLIRPAMPAPPHLGAGQQQQVQQKQQQNFVVEKGRADGFVQAQKQQNGSGNGPEVDVRPADSSSSHVGNGFITEVNVTEKKEEEAGRYDEKMMMPKAEEKKKGAAAEEARKKRKDAWKKEIQQNRSHPAIAASIAAASKPIITGSSSSNNNNDSAGSPKQQLDQREQQQRRQVPVFQITPQQLHMAMQQFFRAQQQNGSSNNGNNSSGTPSSSSESSGYSSAISSVGGLSRSASMEETAAGGGGGAVGVGLRGGPSSPKRQSQPAEPILAATEELDEYVDVVGDGGVQRNSLLKLQRKAHIEFYRKLKSFRNRGHQLDCQLCLTAVSNTDASIRSHVHGHCKTALFVCKLCQRGFQDQHLVFEHIGREHPAHKDSTQFIEDRRDMGVLMELLSECFPRVLCRARDCLFEAIVRLTTWAECQGQAQLQCRLCTAQIQAQKNTLYGHLNVHPSYRCKKCKFSCTDEHTQLEHQRREHPLGLEQIGAGGTTTTTTTKDKAPYCVSLAFDVLLDTLKSCFPLEKLMSSGVGARSPPMPLAQQQAEVTPTTTTTMSTTMMAPPEEPMKKKRKKQITEAKEESRKTPKREQKKKDEEKEEEEKQQKRGRKRGRPRKCQQEWSEEEEEEDGICSEDE